MTIEMREADRPVSARTELITKSDLAWLADKIPTLDWMYAVTYADGAPHEYVTEKTEGMTLDDFERASRVIHTFGEPQKFYKWTRIYLVHEGWKYWTMSDDHRGVGLINRGRAHHVYGVQNAPRTASETATAYDPIATYWDSDYAATEEEQVGITALVDEVTGGYRKCRTLDIGSGTGLTLDLELTDSFRLTAVDPSQPMLNELVRKHPLVARVEPMTFAEACERRVLAGTKFDLVLALGGSASYLAEVDWAALAGHAKGRYVLSAFASGAASPVGDLTDQQISEAQGFLRMFAAAHGGRIVRVGRHDVAVMTR